MAGKCCGNTCACKVVAVPDQAGNQSILVTGTGTTQDPFVFKFQGFTLGAGADIDVIPSWDAFTGYTLNAVFNEDSKLAHLGDVNAPAPSNSQVLGWDTATGKWTPRAAPTATPGAISHGNGINGDGSTGSPLVAVVDTARAMTLGSSGSGLSDNALNRLILHYANSAARAAATLTPLVNSLSVLDTVPGRVDYWDGAAWQPLTKLLGIAGTEALNLSGAYDGRPVHIFVKQVSGTTSSTGDIDLLTAADLTGYAGVLSYHFQPTGTVATGMITRVNSGKITGRQFALTTGLAMATAAVQGILTAYLY